MRKICKIDFSKIINKLVSVLKIKKQNKTKQKHNQKKLRKQK